MDVNGVYQCLAYVRSIQQEAQGAELAEWVVPLISVVLGFVLSLLASMGSAFRRDIRRMKSIVAEVDVIKEQAEGTFKAAIDLAYQWMKDPRKDAQFNPSATISLPLIEQLYPEIAHKFSVNQVKQFQYVPAHVCAINRSVDWIMSNQQGFADQNLIMRVFQLIGDATRLHATCESIKSNSEAQGEINSEDLAVRLGVEDCKIETVLRLSE